MIRALLRGLFAAALLLAVSPAMAYLVTPLGDGRVAVKLTVVEDTRADALESARREAVMGSVGRIFLGEQLLLADSLLEKYLGNYNREFVSAVEVLSERYVGGRNEVTARVFVDFDKLVEDLEEKQFLFRPAFKPRFAAFMTERVDDRISQDGLAREALATAVNNLGIRRYPGELGTPPSTTDVSVDDFLLNAAIVTSQRAGVEVIVTGEARTALQERRALYFGDFWFYDTEIEARLIRVDTGETLFTARARGSASAQDQNEAIRLSIERAANQVARQLVEPFNEFWPVVVQRESDFELLLTGMESRLLSIIEQNIERMGLGTEVHVRKTFDRSAVLAITTNASRQELLAAIAASPYPTLYVVNPDAERVFEVQVTD